MKGAKAEEEAIRLESHVSLLAKGKQLSDPTVLEDNSPSCQHKLLNSLSGTTSNNNGQQRRAHCGNFGPKRTYSHDDTTCCLV